MAIVHEPMTLDCVACREAFWDDVEHGETEVWRYAEHRWSGLVLVAFGRWAARGRMEHSPRGGKSGPCGRALRGLRAPSPSI